MRPFRRIIILFLFFALAGGVWAAIYGKKKGFYETWRTLVEVEFAKQTGFYTKIDKVTLGPLQGLVAEKVLLYWDPERRRKFASVDNVILDLDLTEIMNRDLSINTLDVRDARLWLPLSPERRNGEMLEVDRFSGRLVMTESRIEIVKAKANLRGLEVTLKGSLHRPPVESEAPAEKEEASEAERRQQLQDLVRRFGGRVLAEIDRTEFDPFGLPRLEVEFSGDLNDLGGLRASARLSAEDFERNSYPVQQLSASMEFDGEKGRATLKELHLRDSRGDLRLRADWPIGSNEVAFDLDSNADLPALVTSIYENPRLREVVFFDPPKLKAEGVVNLDELETTVFPHLPANAIGHFSSDRIASRGTVFDGLEFNFSVSGDRAYVRNLRLDHKSGTLLANLMYDPALGLETFRYQTEVKMDPKVFIPFTNSADARKFLSLWSFNRNSSIYIAAMGSGPDLNPDQWQSRGLVDMRRLRLQNVRFNRFESNFEFGGHTRAYRNIRLAGADGVLIAPEAQVNARTGKWRVSNLNWSLGLVEGVRAFSPDLADELAHYRFTKRPEITLDGIIDARSTEKLAGSVRENDFRLDFSSDQPLEHPFLGQTFFLENPKGKVAVDGDRFVLTNFAAGLFGGDVTAEFEIVAGERKTGEVTFENAEIFEIPPFQPLAPLIEKTIPGAEAALRDPNEMIARLRFAEGRFRTEEMRLSTDTMRLTVSGEIDTAGNTVQLEAKVESDPGEGAEKTTYLFKGTGAFASPQWEPIPSSP